MAPRLTVLLTVLVAAAACESISGVDVLDFTGGSGGDTTATSTGGQGGTAGGEGGGRPPSDDPGAALWNTFVPPNMSNGHRFLDAAVTASGDVLVTGEVSSGEIDFGEGPILANVNNRVYVAAFAAADGSLLWTDDFGGDPATVAQQSLAIAAHPSGDYILAGDYTGVIHFNGDPLPAGTNEAFVARVTADGSATHVWSTVIGDNVDSLSLAVTSAGDVILAGEENGTFDAPAGDPVTTAIFVAKLGGDDGNVQWVSGIDADNGSNEEFEDVVVDAEDNVHLAGVFDNRPLAGMGDITGDLSLTPTGSSEVFTIALAGDIGAVIDQRQHGTTSSTTLSSFTVAPNGDRLISARWTDDGVCDGDLVTQGIFLCRFGPNRSPHIVELGDGSGSAFRQLVYAGGVAHVMGDAAESAPFELAGLTGAGFYVGAYDENMAALFARFSFYNHIPNVAVAGPGGELYVAGFFTRYLDLGATPMFTGSDLTAAYVARLDPGAAP